MVTGPGRRPDHPLVAAAAAAGVPVIGEPELAWWIGAQAAHPPTWLVVTGTNGKTTTTGMLEAILRAAGLDAVACGNIGYPVVDAVRAGRRVLAVELSSFQLHWSPSVMPAAGCVLNVAEDHLDWHGWMAAYAAAKARALRGPVAVAGVDDPPAAALLAASPAARRIGVTLGEPGPGQLGVVDGVLVDRAFPAARRGGSCADAARRRARAASAARRHRRPGRRRAGPGRRACAPGASRAGLPRSARAAHRAARSRPSPVCARRRLEGDEPARCGGVAGRAGARRRWCGSWAGCSRVVGRRARRRGTRTACGRRW